MANTTYDELYTSFIRNTHVPNSDLPSTDLGRYVLIQSAIDMYNSEILNTTISGNDGTEELDEDLTPSKLLLLSWYMRKITMNGSTDYKTTLTVPFSKELGKRFVNSQIAGGKSKLSEIDDEISKYIRLTDESEVY